MTPPFVMIPCDNRAIGGHLYHVLGRKYADAVRLAADCLPLIAPTGGASEFLPYLDLADGIVLTGSPANVHPSNFGQDVLDPALPLDEERDSVTLPLVRLATERGIPLLAICRGLQEVNVAMGGSLHQAIHEVPGKRDHREARGVALEQQYGPAHDLEIVPHSHLEQIVGRAPDHGQFAAWPGNRCPGARAHCRSHCARPRNRGGARGRAPGFSLGVQWHPEWQVLENPVSLRIFRAFGEACRAYRLSRTRGPRAPTLPRAA